MRIACILAFSKSIYRHHNHRDFVHMTDLISICEYVKKFGYEAEIFDYLEYENTNKEIIDEKLKAFNPDMLCIWGMFCIEDITDYIHEHIDITQACICTCCGTGALNYKVCLKKIGFVDYVIPSNAEEVIIDIIKISENKMQKVNLLGAAYVDDKQEICFRKRRFQSLDPILEDMDYTKYISVEDKSFAYLWASRGCWYGICTYCNVGAASKLCDGSGWIPYDIHKVFEVIKKLYTIGVTKFHFLDSLFIGPGKNGRDRIKEFSNMVIQSNMIIEFYVDIRIDCIDEELLKLLMKAGLRSLFVGIESASNNILANIKKGYQIEKVTQIIKLLKETGIKFRIGTLLAEPNCTIDDIESTLKYFVDNKMFDNLNIIGVGSIFHKLHLHLGTPIYDQYLEYINDYDIWKGEVACFYKDKNVQRFIECAKSLELEIEKRNNLISMKNIDAIFLKRYLYSLRIIAIYNLLKIIQQIREKSSNDEIKDMLKDALNKHDIVWKGA